MATISVPSIAANCFAWPEPRAPTPIIAMRTVSSFGAAKSPMYVPSEGRFSLSWEQARFEAIYKEAAERLDFFKNFLRFKFFIKNILVKKLS